MAEKLSPEERVKSLEERLRQTFPNPSVALAAITHKSFVNEHKDVTQGHNERLEFLGDAVVDLAISDRLMDRFPLATEGELSRLRALIVNEEGLAKVARKLALGELLLLGRGEDLTGGREKSSLLADALEAVIGAVYLGRGMPGVLELVDVHFGEELDGVAEGRNGLDYKTLLQESVQEKLRVAPRYRVVSESGPDHAKIFEIEVVVGDALYGRASGHSKKEAEQAAAHQALDKIAAGS